MSDSYSITDEEKQKGIISCPIPNAQLLAEAEVAMGSMIGMYLEQEKEGGIFIPAGVLEGTVRYPRPPKLSIPIVPLKAGTEQ